jgi:DNA-binding transcriptional LysR family regulator
VLQNSIVLWTKGDREFGPAAAKVGIGQPPLSQQIKDLEGEVGAALFHRLAHGAELTEAGKAFLAGVKEMPLSPRGQLWRRDARRPGVAASRLHLNRDIQRRRTVGDPQLSPRLSRNLPHARGANTTRLVTGLHEGTLDAVFLRPGTPDTRVVARSAN